MSQYGGSPVQIAWVTRHLEATENALTGLLGVRKWVRMPQIHFTPDTCSYRGEPADFVADVSLSYLGDMQLELIEPVRGKNIYSDFLEASGPGLHHICVEADSPERFAAMLTETTRAGAAVVQQGVMPGGIQFAYVAAPEAGVPFIEIAHIPPEIRAFFDYIKQEQVCAGDDAERCDEEERRQETAGDDAERCDEEERRQETAGDDAERSDEEERRR